MTNIKADVISKPIFILGKHESRVEKILTLARKMKVTPIRIKSIEKLIPTDTIEDAHLYNVFIIFAVKNGVYENNLYWLID
jgi:hypothetical protein